MFMIIQITCKHYRFSMGYGVNTHDVCFMNSG